MDKEFQPHSALLPKHEIETLLSRALSRGGDFAEVFIQRSTSMSIPLQERKIRNASRRVAQGVGIRVISGEKTGYAYSDNLDMQSLADAAEVASRIANGPGSDRAVKITAQLAPDYYQIEMDPDDTSVADRTALLKRAYKAAYVYDQRIKEVDAVYVDAEDDTIIANSEGLWISDHETILRMSVRCMAVQGKVSRSGSYGGGGRVGMEYFTHVSPEEMAQESARVAVLQLDAVPTPAGTMPVVSHSGWGGVLFHEAVGHGLEADFIRKSQSIYTGRVGEKVASELCTVVDDASIPNQRGSYNIDDEGTPGQKKVLIDKGVLRGYMTDRLNAGLMGLPLTGNGRRESYHDVPCPRMSCFYMDAGTSDPQEIIESVDHGVFAKNFSGGQVDIASGSFVFSITEGYLIENGKIGAPLKDATLIGNGPDVLTKIMMVGNDLNMDPGIGNCGKNGQSVPTTVGMPTVKVSEMTVGGTETG